MLHIHSPFQLYQDRRLCILTKEFKSLDVFSRLLYVKGKLHFLVICYQSLLNHDKDITKNLFETYQQYTSKNNRRSDLDLIEMGLRIGSFLNDGGWYDYSIKFLDIAEELLECGDVSTEAVLMRLLECYQL